MIHYKAIVTVKCFRMVPFSMILSDVSDLAKHSMTRNTAQLYATSELLVMTNRGKEFPNMQKFLACQFASVYIHVQYSRMR